MTIRARFVADMTAWLNRRFAPAGTFLTPETPLFADGLINSIRILDMIAWVERAIGRPIPDVQIRMDNFRTVQRIGDVFLPEPSRVDV
ncbi:MAG: hypothetical protein ACRENJ_03600 [Candidatus Eiseniibacteriota bacterium]